MCVCMYGSLLGGGGGTLGQMVWWVLFVVILGICINQSRYDPSPPSRDMGVKGGRLPPIGLLVDGEPARKQIQWCSYFRFAIASGARVVHRKCACCVCVFYFVIIRRFQ